MSRDSIVCRDPMARPQARRREEAARWFITLQEAELTERVLKSWKQWEAIPENREAFDAVEHVWQLAGHVPELPVAHPEERALDCYDASVPVSSYLWRLRRTAGSIVSSRLRFFWRAFGLAAALAVVMLVTQTIPLLQPFIHSFTGGAAPDRTVVVETGLGEHKQVVFEDGSRIYLGAETSITASFSKSARSVALDRGVAHFKVARDPQRPFRVDAGGGTITAVGTAFNVQHRQDNDVVVTVTEGVVEVAPVVAVPGKPGEAHSADEHPTSLRVTRGQEVTYDAEGRVSPVRVAEVMATIAWRDGRFKYSGEPLRHVIEDINRYSRHKILLDDSTSTVGDDLLYSGTVFTSDIHDWVTGLEKTYPKIEVTMMPDASVLIRARRATQEQEP